MQEAFAKMREGEADAPKAVETNKDTAFMSAEFQDYLQKHKIQHVTKDVMADNQLSLVDSKMGQLKKEMFMNMAKDADAEARIHGISSWSEWLRSKPDAKEPDWHTYFTRAVRELNAKPLDYLMGRSVRMTFDDDGRPRKTYNDAEQEKNEAVYMQTQGHQARVLKKNRKRILRNQDRVAPRDAAGILQKGGNKHFKYIFQR